MSGKAAVCAIFCSERGLYMRYSAVIPALTLLLSLLTGCASEPAPQLPENLTLYLEGQQRIVTLTREEYLIGCILACADPSFQQEALNAIAAACCSQAIYAMNGQPSAEFLGADLSDGHERCPAWISPEAAEEEYGGEYGRYALKAEQAAEFACSISLTYEGEPAYTPVFRTSTGVTDDGGMPYLPSLRLPEDAASPWYSSVCTVTAEYVRKELRRYTGSVVLPPKVSDWFTAADYSPGGMLRSICFGGAEISGEQLRQAFGLRSSAITVSVSGEDIMLTSLGCGGNIGMSAYSAERLARSGLSAEEILQRFFPKTELRQVLRRYGS